MSSALATLLRPLCLGLLLLFAVVSRPDAKEPVPGRTEPVSISTATGSAVFSVEIAETDAQRERGLMFRRHLAPDHGMLFDFGQPRPVAMWMKNTYIGLDMLFIRADGTIVSIAANAKPRSLDTIEVREPVKGVLELAGGTAHRLALRVGDVVHHRIFGNAG